MSFLRLLPLLILLPVLAMADADRNFKVNPDQFKVGETVAPVPGMALATDGITLVAQKPFLPLQPGKIYLRHKLGPKEFQWVGGTINTTNFQKLHAFNLEKNHLKVLEVINLRFYATQNARAFQDETDIYFDKDYIYSSRVPKLFFMKNGRWQVLNEDPLPGVIKFDMKQKNAAATILNEKVDNDIRLPFVAAPGTYVFSFVAPDYLPYVDIDVLNMGKVLVVSPALLPMEKTSAKQMNLKVTKESVVNAKTLEETEALHDAYILELQSAVDVVDTMEFNGLYPQPKDAALLGIEPEDETYAFYRDQYESKRQNALAIWRESKMGGVQEIDSVLKAKLDSLQKLPFRGMLMPTSVTAEFDTLAPVPDSTQTESPAVASSNSLPASSLPATADSSLNADSAQLPPAPITKVKSLSLYFGMAGARYDVTWNGTVPEVSMDTLYELLSQNSSNVKVYFTLQNNKPVWVYTDNVIPRRYHYRYTKLEVEVNGKLYVATGAFVLPEHIFKQEEVQEWLNPKPVESSSSVEVPSSSSEVVAPVSSSSEEVKAPEPVMKLVNDKMRGQLALIDSGSFRYYGNVVTMSPFAIMTKEMTQNLFIQLMASIEDTTKRINDRSSFKDAQKPVHNISWNDAREVCKMLDGDLPTEAQWEFAARAGSNEGFLWTSDSATAGDYAIYRDNSYKAKKTDAAYGPQKVGSKKPNAWGLYDVSGNVAEWTRDRYFMFSFYVGKSNPTGAMFGSSKVYKGGSWKDKEKLLNLSTRDDEDPRYWSDGIGFRCVFPRDKFESTGKKTQGK